MPMFEPNWWNDFKEWETDYKDSADGMFALSKMEDKLGKGKYSKYYKILEDQVLKNCFFAATYEKQKDSDNNLRNRYGREFSDELKKQIKKIGELRAFIAKYPEIPKYGFKYNKSLKEKELFIYSKDNTSPPFDLNFDRLLEIYSEILKKPKTPKYSGPGGYRFIIGGICYPHDLPLDGKKQRPQLSTVLGFRLVELFRQHTNPEGSWEKALINFHRPMPEYGQPCFELVGNFINPIFGSDRNTSDIKKTVNELSEKKVSICPWPQQSRDANQRFFVEEGVLKPIVNKGGVLIPINFL
jgi:hypothetical protein